MNSQQKQNRNEGKTNQQNGPGWLNELGSWITGQLIQAYHQYGVGSHLAL